MGQRRFVPFVDRQLADAHGMTLEQLHESGSRVVTDAPAFRGRAGGGREPYGGARHGSPA